MYKDLKDKNINNGRLTFILLKQKGEHNGKKKDVLDIIKESMCEVSHSDRVRGMMKGVAWSFLPGKNFPLLYAY